MSKDKNYYGIDISKDVFDVYSKAQGNQQYSNDQNGFKKFVDQLSENPCCIMEATGYYHYQLAYYLLNLGLSLSVENPLKIKRFIQMNLSKVKTDKSDAKQIYNYALNVKIQEWKGESKGAQESRQLLSLLDTYTKQSTQLKNKIHGEKVLGKPSKTVIRSLQRSVRFNEKEQYKLEIRLMEIVEAEHQALLTRIETIPGIGRKTALMLIVFTNGFKDFETSSQLCSYAGLTPIIKQSGSSVRGKERISKMGNRKLRNLLFMCSFNACKYNAACKALYERIVAKGKSKKLALIAVCNKLLKQAFALAKNGLIYDPNYVSTLVKK